MPTKPQIFVESKNGWNKHRSVINFASDVKSTAKSEKFDSPYWETILYNLPQSSSPNWVGRSNVSVMNWSTYCCVTFKSQRHSGEDRCTKSNTVQGVNQVRKEVSKDLARPLESPGSTRKRSKVNPQDIKNTHKVIVCLAQWLKIYFCRIWSKHEVCGQTVVPYRSVLGLKSKCCIRIFQIWHLPPILSN